MNEAQNKADGGLALQRSILNHMHQMAKANPNDNYISNIINRVENDDRIANQFMTWAYGLIRSNPEFNGPGGIDQLVTELIQQFEKHYPDDHLPMAQEELPSAKPVRGNKHLAWYNKYRNQ